MTNNMFRRSIDSLKDDVLESLFKKAREINQDIGKLKTETLEEIDSYVEVLGEDYNVKVGGVKGNITITNSNSTLKLQKVWSEFIAFDERLQVAKKLIDKCIVKWSDTSREEIKILVNQAFEVDKAGKVSTTRILSLRRLNIKDSDWQGAMRALGDSLLSVGRKAYVKFYYREDKYGEWKALNIDIAKVGGEDEENKEVNKDNI